MNTVIISGVFVINTPSGSFITSSTGALVQLPFLLVTNTRTLFTLHPLHTLSSGVKFLHHQIQARGKGIGSTHQHRSTHLTFLQYTLLLSLQLQMYSSSDIPNPQRPLYTLTVITTVSREMLIATLIIMVLNHTLINTCLLVPSLYKNIPLGYTNQALHHLTQIFVWLNLPCTFRIQHFPPQNSLP